MDRAAVAQGSQVQTIQRYLKVLPRPEYPVPDIRNLTLLPPTSVQQLRQRTEAELAAQRGFPPSERNVDPDLTAKT